MKKNTPKGMWRRTLGIYRSIRIPWPLYFLQVILGIISTKAALLYVPYLTDLKLGNIQDAGAVWGYIGFMLLAAVTQMAEQIPGFYSQALVERRLQDKLIRRSLYLPMRFFEQNASQIVSWITQDCSCADGLLTSVIGFLTGIVSTWMSVSSMSAVDAAMWYLVPVLLVYVIFGTWFEGKMLFLRERRGRAADAELTAYLSEHLSFFTQMKQLHLEQEELARGQTEIRTYYQAEIYQALLTLASNFVSGSITGVLTILVFLLGIPKVNDGSITLAALAAFQSYILIAYQSFSSLPGLYTDFMYYNGRLFYAAGLMAEKEEDRMSRQKTDLAVQELKFDDVTFGYGEEPILEHVTFTVPKGKTTLIVGPNGSGKTTLLKLLERFYIPDSGTIRFGFEDAGNIPLQEWRQSIAYVLQEPQLFNGTVRENINYGADGEVPWEATEHAARRACADEFIRELPDGYDSNIGDNGSRLSAGQRQRIAIARAILTDPSYLLLDEATCNMDVYSRKAVEKALKDLMAGKTTVMISHDMSQLERADHIVVLNHGAVEAEGTKEEVLQNSPTLKKMIAANA